MRKMTFALLALVLVACQPGTNTHPVPSVVQIGADLHCTGGDHGVGDTHVRWGVWSPPAWEQNRRAQTDSPNPAGLNLGTLPSPCAAPAPVTAYDLPHPLAL